MTEMWDLVDENGEKVGIRWQRADHRNIPEGYYHPCVEIWVKVGERVLVTQRHPDKSEGLKYDAPGGAVLAGEEIACGAIRELAEESGILTSVDKIKYLGAVIGRKAYAVSFLLELFDMPEIKIQPTEVVGYKFVTKNELEDMLSELCEGCRRRYLLFKDEIF